MGLSLESMAIEMPVVHGHPNRVGFRGVLTFVDAVSDKSPAGARGHRVLLTRKAGEAAIPTLLGMALDYSPRLDTHDTRRKIGVITRAEIAGREITIRGFLYGRDFPEIVAEIGKNARILAPTSRIERAGLKSFESGLHGGVREGTRSDGRVAAASVERVRGRAGLGMSYEIADAVVEDIKANVWVLNRVTFTGAAVLRRDKAAYQGTWIELG